jgi:hypothetical protein
MLARNCTQVNIFEGHEMSETEVSRAAKTLSKLGASKGGLARAETLTPEKRTEIAKIAAAKRWGIPASIKEGELKIGDIRLSCAVLDNQTRVMSRASFIKALGRTGKAKGGRKYDDEFKTPVFLTAENLKPFVSNNLIENSSPILYRGLNGKQSIGYKAELLPQVCYVFVDADDAKMLQHNQKHIAEKCRLLIRGFVTVGIIALVDEATGYQEIRDRLALQEILDQFLRKEFAAWAKCFPEEFYRQIFRLRQWEWRGMKVNRPQIVAYYTKDLIYARLAPGILKELELRNPKNEKGRRKAPHYWWLTEDVGHPALAQLLFGVIGLMRAADEWDEFMTMINRSYPRRNDTSQLDLFRDDSELFGVMAGTVPVAK